MRKIYEVTKDIQVELIIQRKKEEQLIARRTELERRLKSVCSTLTRAEFVTSHIASAMNYLNIAFINMDDAIEEVQKKEELGVQIIMAQARSEIRELQYLARGSLKDLRKIIFDLRPMSLDDLGLVPALKQYINRFIDDTGIDVILQAYQEDIHVDSLVEVAVFRIIQEALNNIVKHANSNQVSIYLSIQENMILCSIIDKGIGFDGDNPTPNVDKDITLGGFGIYGMRQRAELLKGKLGIKSRIGKGTTIRVEIPLNSLER